MKSMTLPILLLLVAALVGAILLVVLIYNALQNARLEKRFEDFSMHASNDEFLSFLDTIIDGISIFITKFSHILMKFGFLRKYANHYLKYISYEEKEDKEPMEYIAVKLFVGAIFLFLSLITSFLKTKTLSPVSSLLSFLIGFFLYDFVLWMQFQKKRRNIENDLVKAIMIMNNSFKSGKNIMQAIVTVKNELDGPISLEFKKIYMDMTYGLSLDVVFNRFYERVKLEDAKYIASSLTLLDKTGGNIIKVFETIEKSFYSKKRMRDELKSMTAASVFVYRVLVVLPLLFTTFIFIVNPNYFAPFFNSFIGLVVFSFILILYFCYIGIIRKILEVKM